MRAQRRRPRQPGGRQHLRQRVQGVAVEVADPHRLVGRHQRPLAQRVLRRDAGRAAVGVAALRLDAADREHEAARRVRPVGAEREHAGDVEGADDLATGADADALAQARAHQRVVHEQQALAHRHADVIGELERRGAGATLGPVDHDEVGRDAGLEHRLDDGHELPRMADAELEADRLAAGELAQRATNCSRPRGESKALWRAGEMQSTPGGTPRVAAISAETLCAGRMPPCPGLAPWLSLISIIFTCGSAAWRANARGVEATPRSSRQPK
jgi:hypothetical protein